MCANKISLNFFRHRILNITNGNTITYVALVMLITGEKWIPPGTKKYAMKLCFFLRSYLRLLYLFFFVPLCLGLGAFCRVNMGIMTILGLQVALVPLVGVIGHIISGSDGLCTVWCIGLRTFIDGC